MDILLIFNFLILAFWNFWETIKFARRGKSSRRRNRGQPLKLLGSRSDPHLASGELRAQFGGSSELKQVLYGVMSGFL